jgi:hypothetical protein
MNDHDIAILLREVAEPVPAPDFVDAVRGKAPAVRRRRIVVGVTCAVAAVVVASTGVVVTAGLDDSGQRSDTPVTPPSEPAQVADQWVRVDDFPLSHRDDPLVAHVGDSIVVVGGTHPFECPLGAFCPPPRRASGGAAYDLPSGAWHAMAKPPEAMAAGMSYGVDGDRLMVLTQSDIWSYDVSSDVWTTLPAAPLPSRGDGDLAVGGGYAYLRHGDRLHTETRYQRLDLATGEWTWLPRSLNKPMLRHRRLIVTPHGIVVMGTTGDVNGVHLHLQAEILENGQWTRLPNPHLSSTGWPWRWTGDRLVAPLLGDNARGATLDVTSGQWGRLTTPPPPIGGQGWLFNATNAGDLIIESQWGGDESQYIYSDADQSWSVISAPTESSAAAGGSGAFADGMLYAVDRQSRFWRLAVQ